MENLMRSKPAGSLLAALSVAVVLGACGGGSESGATDFVAQMAPPAPSGLSEVASIGRLAFFDPNLSASGRQSCASCHDPRTGHASPNALPVQPGGADLQANGLRSSPSIRYLKFNKAFTLDADGNPSGGFFWDGRANNLVTQAAGPLLGAREMANASAADVAQRIGQSAWAARFIALYGPRILGSPDLALQKLGEVLEAYQDESPEFHPFDSKFDAVNAGTASFSAAEMRGQALFNDPGKGNCAACHSSTPQTDGRPALFTDFSYDNLGVPRNQKIPANNDSTYFDLGLCARPDIPTDRRDLCGAFKVPSLRNVALRQVYFHNGKFSSLRDVVSFYVTRDTNPERWYPRRPDGSVAKFDDLPSTNVSNVNTTEVPYNRKRGQEPALNEAEIDDVVEFLRTLSDGWKSQ